MDTGNLTVPNNKTEDVRVKSNIEVGCIVKPGTRPSSSSYYGRSNKYTTLDYSSTYRVTGVFPRKRTTVVTLEPYQKNSTKPSFNYDQCSGQLYSTTGLIYVSGSGETTGTELDSPDAVYVHSVGTVSPEAEWIIVDGKTGAIVAAVNPVEVPALDPQIVTWKDDKLVKATADALATQSIRKMAEDRVNEIIDENLRKNPTGLYRAYKIYKIGNLPELPVKWSTP